MENKEKARQKLFRENKKSQDLRTVEIINKIMREEEHGEKIDQQYDVFLRRSKEEPIKLSKERVRNTLSRVKNLESYRKSINESYFDDDQDLLDDSELAGVENLDSDSNFEYFDDQENKASVGRNSALIEAEFEELWSVQKDDQVQG